MGLPAVFSCTYEVNRFRNLGYSLFATALNTDAGAQPPGFTVPQMNTTSSATPQNSEIKWEHKSRKNPSLPLATYVILHRMLSRLISLSPSGGLTSVWQIMAMLILARTHLLLGWKSRQNDRQQKAKCETTYDDPTTPWSPSTSEHSAKITFNIWPEHLIKYHNGTDEACKVVIYIKYLFLNQRTLPGHCRGRRRSCRRSTCRGRSHYWKWSSGWLIGTGRPSATRATPSVKEKRSSQAS